jgi:site-specific DNA recombinase
MNGVGPAVALLQIRTDGEHMNVAIYVRVACRQRDNSAVAAQQESLERYCTRHGLTVTRRYCDDGTSGLLPLDQRSAGRRLLRDARLGRFDQLLVSAPDRLGRDVRVVLKAVTQLQECGVFVRTMADGLSEADAWAQLTSRLMSGLPLRKANAAMRTPPAKHRGRG